MNSTRPYLLFIFILALCIGSTFTGCTKESDSPSPPHTSATASSSTQLWTCSMHPQVLQDHPGQCPICHMELVPVPLKTSPTMKTDAASPLTTPPSDAASLEPDLTIDPRMVQNMGIRTAKVREVILSQEIQAVGYLSEAEPNVREINLLISGWVKKLYVSATGASIDKDQPLFDLYSPELSVALQELFATKRAASSPASEEILSALRGKLTLWGIDQRIREKIEHADSPPSLVTFTSPIAGIVTEKNVIEGGMVKAGERIFRIADLSTVWLNARVFEKDLPTIARGQKVTAQLQGKTVEGEILFIEPQVDPATRTVNVRVALPNAELALRPGMYATLVIKAESTSPVLAIPREAIIDSGRRKIVFVAKKGGTFSLREVESGRTSDSQLVEIRSGVSRDELVVTSGQFLLDSESRLQEAVQKYLHQKDQIETSPTREHNHD